MHPPLLELEGVCRHFYDGQVVALDNVSLQLHHGDYLTITGPSGSGKSTLLHILSGLDRPERGRVRFEGREPGNTASWTRLRARRIGFVFQLFHLLPDFTVAENVEMPMVGIIPSAAERRKRVRQLLDQTGMAQCAGRRARELSGGESQCVAIARSLANQPDLLLADEPTGNLDSRNGEKIIHLIEDLRTEAGLTLILVTHDPVLAGRGSRQAQMRDGRLLMCPLEEGR